MIIIHPLKEWVSLDLFNSRGSNPVLTLTTEPKKHKDEKQNLITWDTK